MAARYSVGFNGLSALALTRLDVLDGLPALKLCTAYEIDGEMVKTMPASASALRRAKPVYEELPGWTEPTSGLRERSTTCPRRRRCTSGGWSRSWVSR